MKFTHILPLTVLGSAFVLPTEEVLNEIAYEDNHRSNGWYQDALNTKDQALADAKEKLDDISDSARDAWDRASKSSKNAFDDAHEYTIEIVEDTREHIDDITDTAQGAWNQANEKSRSAFDRAYEYTNDIVHDAREKVQDVGFDVKSWLETEVDDVTEYFEGDKDGPPHHGPPHRGPPGKGKRPHHPHHPPHHGKSNLTVYQMIAESKYTTKLAKLINKYDDLVETLNSTKANYTVFAPTDKAFENIPEHGKHPSKEILKAILSYHVVPDFLPAGKVFGSHTAPTLLESDELGASPKPQRLAFKLGFRGLSVNFYSHIVAANIFGTNGVIHGVDSIIVPPPRAVQIINLLPGEFSTLELGLTKTGLLEALNSTKHQGGTMFAPSNFAFKKLGPKVNAFLFSKFGLKYLKALLEYHVVPEHTLYSDAYYKPDGKKESVDTAENGYFAITLPTLLEDRSLNIAIARYGRFISMKINAFSRVSVQDGVARDGVIHVVSDVLVPPKKLDGPGKDSFWSGEEMTVEELVERLEPYVMKSDL